MEANLSDRQTDPWRSTLAANLGRLVALRWFVITGCLVLLSISLTGIEFVIATPAAWASLALYATANVGVWLLLRQRELVGEGVFLANLVLDLLVLFVFLHQTGGSTNPFTPLFLLPVIVAAATLKATSIWVVTALSIGVYTLLIWRTPKSHDHHGMQPEFDLHVVGMWLGLTFLAGLVAYFVTWMGRALRDRERALSEARERALRDERIIALGAMAAGAAHELGTPLSTITVLLKEMEQGQEPLDTVTHKRINLLRTQVDRCKSVLSALSAHGHEIRAEAGHGSTPTIFLEALIRQWQVFRPDVKLHFTWHGPAPSQLMLADQTLGQALCSFLNNAADASSELIEVTGWQDGNWLNIQIDDQGEGISEQIARNLGSKPISTKSGGRGMGIGMLLAHSVIDRLGGRAEIISTGDQGTSIRIRLPLDKLLFDPVERFPQQPAQVT